MKPSPFSVGEIGQVNAMVSDIEKSVQFYRENLGVELLYADAKTALCECNGTRLMLNRAVGGRHIGQAVIYFKVEDLYDVFLALKVKGVALVASPKTVIKLPGYSLVMAFFKDPDGNLLALVGELAINEPRTEAVLEAG